MPFEWNRMYKFEENIENEIKEDVRFAIEQHYGVDDIYDLDEEQIKEIEEFAAENEFSILQYGFREILYELEQ